MIPGLKKFWKKKADSKTQSVEEHAIWQQYLAHFLKGYSKKTLIQDLRFVVLDTETTGLDRSKDKILSVAAIEINKQRIHLNSALDFYLFQTYDPQQSAIKIHQIVPKKEEDTLSEELAVEKLLSFIGGSILVGHHISFDIGMINQILLRLFGGELKNHVVDTANLVLRTGDFSTLSQVINLDAALEYYKVTPIDRHTAGGDVFMTAILFLKLLPKLKKRGIQNLADLLRPPLKQFVY